MPAGQKAIFKGNVSIIHNHYKGDLSKKQSPMGMVGNKFMDATSGMRKYRMKKVTNMAMALDNCDFYEENKTSQRLIQFSKIVVAGAAINALKNHVKINVEFKK